MSEGQGKKRKSKGWYRKQAFHNKHLKTDDKRHRLVPGLKGFIVTCNEHEKEAVKETYNILNEYADKLYGPETKEEAENSGESDGDDIEKAIAKEVQSLKEVAASDVRRFQNSQSGAKNCIFIKTTVDDPSALAHAIFSDLLQTKMQKSRYALRLLPVLGTCKANLKEITELAKEVLKPFFSETKFQVTYVILFKARNNNGLGREMTISTLRNAITETFSSALLQFTRMKPEVTILVEVMCGVACIAVAKDFDHFRKYNLVEVVSERQAPDVGAGECTVKPEHQKTLQTEDSGKEAKCQQQGKVMEVINVSEEKPSVLDTKSEMGVHHELEVAVTNTDSQYPYPEIDTDVVQDNSCSGPAVVSDQDNEGDSVFPQECVAKIIEQSPDSLLKGHVASGTATVVVDQTAPAESGPPSTETQ